MSLTNHFGPDDGLNPPNEALLNVIRESDKRGVGTSEIVRAVDLGADAVRERLHGLEAEGRVESDTIGSEHDYDFVWYIADAERTQTVNPDITKLVRWCEYIKEIGESTLMGAKIFGGAGIVVIILTLTAVAEGFALGGLDSSVLIYVGWATVIGGGSSRGRRRNLDLFCSRRGMVWRVAC